MSEQRKNNPNFKPPSPEGKKWINNGVINKLVYPDEISYYIENGFKLGKLPYKKQNIDDSMNIAS